MKKYRNAFILLICLVCYACSEDETPSTPINPTPPSVDTTDMDIALEERNLPQFIISTNGNTVVDEPKIGADMIVLEQGDTTYDGRIGIEFRGSTSQSFDKKSYGFETWDSEDQDIDASLLGFPEEEDWILYGPYSDKTLLRNALIYRLSNDLGEYASRTQAVELTLNRSYEGIYVFMEKLKRDGDRIDIKKLDEDDLDSIDITGGYILKIDKSTGDANGSADYPSSISFRSEYDTEGQKISYSAHGPKRSEETYFLYEYPDAEDITAEQKTYIQGYISEFEDALIEEDYLDEHREYEEYIDIESFAYHFILNELSGNPDAYRLSTFMHKNREGKLRMGPIWDFNIAFGLDNRSNPTQWVYEYNRYYPNDLWLVHFWWDMLLEDPKFRQQIKDIWQQERSEALSEASINAIIDTEIESMMEKAALGRNFDRWDVLGVPLPFNGYVGQDYDDEVQYIKRWIDQRLAWMDGQIASF